MNSNPELLALAATRLGWAVIHSLWQGALAGLLIAVLLRLMHRRSASARHAVCLGGMLAVSIAVVVTVLYSPQPRSARPSPAPMAISALAMKPNLPGTAIDDAAPAQSKSVTTGRVRKAARVPAEPWSARIAPAIPWISAVWLLGVLLLTARQCGGWWCVRRWRLAGTAVDPEIDRCFAKLLDRFGLRHATRVLVSAQAGVPMLVGFVKPMVLLPARVLSGLGPLEVEAILAHELAHLSRRDAWANLAQVIVETVLFYHPVVWWLGRRAREEREIAADDLALQVCTDRRRYAGALARLAEIEMEPALALAATGGSLLTRIRRILAKPVPEPAPGLGLTVPISLAAMLVATLAISRAATPPVIEVAAGQPLQAAIDAAPPGAVLRLAAGEWKERIEIRRPITLEGAGWDKTIIKPDQPALDTNQQPKTSLTILIAGPDSVTLRGLRIGGVGPAIRDKAGGDTLVAVMRGGVTISDCALVGPGAIGVLMVSRSDVKIERSLIAGFWGTGIVVHGRSDHPNSKAARLHLVESEVRVAYHSGIDLGRGCDDSVIERCRISGSARHGIVYKDASPTITGNAIFAHALSGIEASGKTAAKVRGNVFWRNTTSGITCSGPGEDTIEENTFVGNKREALVVRDGARPIVRRNIFSLNETAIVCVAKIDGIGDDTKPGEPVLDTNLFSQNKDVLTVMTEKKPAPAGSLLTDPKFRDAAKADFALQPDSPARAAKIGAAEPLAPSASPWQLLAEEKAMIPLQSSRGPNVLQRTTGIGASDLSDLANEKIDLERKLETLTRDLAATRARLDAVKLSLPTIPLSDRVGPKPGTDASNVFLNAFLSYQQGEKATAANDPRGARARYEETITMLDSISNNWPDWNPSIVDHRRRKAVEKLQKLPAE